MFKKIFLVAVAIILTKNSFAVNNTTYPTYDLQKDKHWIDSLKHTIKNGYPNVYKKQRGLLQLLFIRNCITLGQYYERLFEMQRLPDMKASLLYYEKVTGVNIPYESIEYKMTQDIIDKLCKKVENIYFKGIGVKKDRVKSFYLAMSVTRRLDSSLFKFYSLRYFNCNDLILKRTDSMNYQTDSVFDFVLNPFVEIPNLNSNDINDTILRKLVTVFKQRSGTEKIYLKILEYPGPSMLMQFYAETRLDNVLNCLINKYSITNDKIDPDLLVGEGPEWIIYKRVKMPFLEIKFTKIPRQ